MKVKLERWPWQAADLSPRKNYGWFNVSKRHLWGRFGGGWNYKLGIAVGNKTIILDLLFGIVRISWAKPAPVKS